MRIEGLLRESARRLPAKAALVAGRKRLSFAEIDLMSDRLATALATRGIARGDRVAIFMENRWEAVVSTFAVLKAGAIVSPVGPSIDADQLAFMLNECGAAGLITQAKMAPIAAEAVAAAPSVKLAALAGGGAAPLAMSCLRFEDAIRGIGRPAMPSSVESDLDPGVLFYASGPGGASETAKMTHRSVLADTVSVASLLDGCADDIILGLLPFSSAQGLCQVLASISMGATLILESSPSFPKAILNRLAAEKVTGLSLTPTMTANLSRMKGLSPGRYPHLRFVAHVSAPPLGHVARLRELFPSARLLDLRLIALEGEGHLSTEASARRVGPARGDRTDRATKRFIAASAMSAADHVPFDA